MTSSAANASFNLATLTADARALIEADKQACLIRWKVRDLKGPEKQRQGNVCWRLFRRVRVLPLWRR